MDTVFKIKEDNNYIYYGANNFGYDDKVLKATYLLLKKLEKKTLTKEDNLFLNDNLYLFDGSKEVDIEVYIDLEKRMVVLDLFNIKRKYSADASYIYEAESLELFLKKQLNLAEFFK